MKHSELFLLRIWTQNANTEAGGGFLLRGKVQHTVNGEAHEFSSWDELVEAVRSMLPASAEQNAHDVTGEEGER